MAEPAQIEMTRSVGGNWEADFVAERRETIVQRVLAAVPAGIIVLGLLTIWICEKPTGVPPVVQLQR